MIKDAPQLCEKLARAGLVLQVLHVNEVGVPPLSKTHGTTAMLSPPLPSPPR